MFKLVLEKAEDQRQIANIRWIMEKAREFQKNIYFCFIDYARPPDLPLEKPICRSGSNSLL